MEEIVGTSDRKRRRGMGKWGGKGNLRGRDEEDGRRWG